MRPYAFAAAILLAALAHADDQIVAVLPLETSMAKFADPEADRMAMEEMLRSLAGTELEPLGYTVLTGETTLKVLADNGVNPQKACEASCALEAARELKAKLFLSGSVITSDGALIANIRLFDSETGRIVASTEVEGESVRSLRKQFKEEASSFFQRGLARRKPPASVAAPEGRIGPSAGGFDVQQSEALVKFTSVPDGALLSVDGVVLCQATPCSKLVPTGVHEISLQKEGYESLRHKATLAKGVEVKFELVATFGTLEVLTNPPGLDVRIDRTRTLRSPAKVQLDPGSHELLVADPCHEATGEVVNVTRGAARTVTLESAPRQAGLRLVAQDERGNDIEADVLVDGVPVGTAPNVFKVPACAKRVEVRASGGRGWSADLSLVERETTALEARLKVLHSGIDVELTAQNDDGSEGAMRLLSGTETYTCPARSSAETPCVLRDVIPGNYAFEAGYVKFPVEVLASGSANATVDRPYVSPVSRFLPLLGLSLLVPGIVGVANAPGTEAVAYSPGVSTGVMALLGGLTVAIVGSDLKLPTPSVTTRKGVRAAGEATGSLGRLRLRTGTGLASGLSRLGAAIDLRTFVDGRLVLSAGFGLESTTYGGLSLAATFGPRAGEGGPFASAALTRVLGGSVDPDCVRAPVRTCEIGSNRVAAAAGWEFHPGFFESLRVGAGAHFADVTDDAGVTTSALQVWPEFSYGLHF